MHQTSLLWKCGYKMKLNLHLPLQNPHLNPENLMITQIGEEPLNRSQRNKFGIVVPCGKGRPSQVSEILHRNRAEIRIGMAVRTSIGTPCRLALASYAKILHYSHSLFLLQFLYLLKRLCFTVNPGYPPRFSRVR